MFHLHGKKRKKRKILFLHVLTLFLSFSFVVSRSKKNSPLRVSTQIAPLPTRMKSPTTVEDTLVRVGVCVSVYSPLSSPSLSSFVRIYVRVKTFEKEVSFYRQRNPSSMDAKKVESVSLQSMPPIDVGRPFTCPLNSIRGYPAVLRSVMEIVNVRAFSFSVGITLFERERCVQFLRKLLYTISRIKKTDKRTTPLENTIDV